MDKTERMELRRRRLERLGKWESAQKVIPAPQFNLNVQPTRPPVVTNNPNPHKRCGCSRSRG